MSIFKSTASFRDFQRPEYALKHFIRFIAAKVAITYAMDLMTAIYSICGGVVEQIASSLGGIGAAVGIYFGLSKVLDKETVSWLCIVYTVPLPCRIIKIAKGSTAGICFLQAENQSRL